MSMIGSAMAEETATGADLLVESLIGHGIEVIFGVPGDTGVNFYDALSARQGRIRHIMALDERHSGYMADAYARSSRKIAVAEASSGAGAVYLASGLAESYASSIPVVVVTTDIHRTSRGSGAITEIDQAKLFSAVTKKQYTAERASDIPHLVAEAVFASKSGRPGPVVLICPEDVLDEYSHEIPSVGSNFVDAESVLPDEVDLRNAEEILRTAKKPAILAGGGVHMSGAWDELRLFAEHLAIPVGTTIHGKSSFPEDHQLSLGVTGGNGSRGYALSWIEESDAVLIVGSRSNSTDTNGFTAPSRQGAKVMQIDIDEERAGRNFVGSVGLVGDAGSTLRVLRNRLVAADDSKRQERSSWVKAQRETWQEKVLKPLPPLDAGVLQPRDIIQILHGVFGPQTWTIADPGTPTPNLSAYWTADSGSWRTIVPRGHGPMGYAISASIGVSLAHPGDRVLCITTEGSLAMGIADWETAARLQLPITFVVLNNTSFAWIKMLQHLFMDGRYFQVDPGPIDPAILARGMGLEASAPKSLEDLEAEVRKTLTRNGPSVIHVGVPPHHESPPPVAPWQHAIENPNAGRPVY